jgi:hypothetical protein
LPPVGGLSISRNRASSVIPVPALDFSVIVITILVCSLLTACWRDSDR